MQEAVIKLIALGRFPPDIEATEEAVDLAADLIGQVRKPISKAEAIELVKLFGPDTYFGVAWSLLHLIETCVDLPLDFADIKSDAGWLERLQVRGRF